MTSTSLVDCISCDCAKQNDIHTLTDAENCRWTDLKQAQSVAARAGGGHLAQVGAGHESLRTVIDFQSKIIETYSSMYI